MEKISRRKFVLGGIGFLSASFASLLGIGYLLRNKIIAFLTERIDNRQRPRTSISFLDSDACMVTTETIEGPYYLPKSMVRSDIRENQAGENLRLRLKFVDADNCQSLSNVEVDVWHCGADGEYSSYTDEDPNQINVPLGHAEATDATTFLRGRQITDANGFVEFLTVYPGWYAPRTPHIHLKAFLDEKEMITTHLYFPDELNEKIQTTAAAYKERGLSPFNNRNDTVIALHKGSAGGWLKITPDAEGYLGTLTIGIRRKSIS